MTTEWRSTYNWIQELTGMVNGLNEAINLMNDEFSEEAISNLYSMYSDHLKESKAEWTRVYSSNHTFYNSKLNLETNPMVYNKLFYSNERAEAYTKIKQLSGAVHGLSSLKYEFKLHGLNINTIIEFRNRMKEILNNRIECWNEHYEHNKTHNSYELNS